MLYRVSIFTAILLFVFACGQEEEVSFKEVQDVIHRNCFSCHNPSGAAPFSLYSYQDIKRKAKTIKEVVESGYMPPWPASTTYRHFLGEKVLSENEKRLLLNWIRQGAKQDEKAPSDSVGGSLPQMPIDMYAKDERVSFSMTEKIPLAGDNKDRFYLVKIPIELERDTFIKSIYFNPGNKKLVHHMNGHWLNYEEELKTNLYEGKSYVDAEKDTDLRLFLEMGLEQNDGSFPELTPSVVNYLPGMRSNVYPKDIGGFKAKKKSTLLIQSLHYGPSAVESEDLSSISIEFMDGPPQRPLKEIQLGSLGLSAIEPPFILEPEEIKKFKTAWQTNKDISLLTVIPHMHLLGKKYKAYAIGPSQDTIRLIKINNWDFRWQYSYTFPKIQVIPKGYTIVAEAEFDNTSDNPNQAFHPPKRIVEPRSLNMKTTDEMFQLILMYVDYQKGDEGISLDTKNPLN